MLPHSLTKFEISNIFKMNQNLMVYLRNNLSKKNGVYTINLDEYKTIGIHWIALYVIDDNVTYFDIFRAEYLLKKF